MRTERIVVIGSSNTDMVVKLGHLPVPGETVLGGAFVTAGGGKGANQAIAACRLGATVTLVARVGEDPFGRAALASFESEDIDTRHVTVDPNAPSGVALIYVDGVGENMIAVAPGANARLTVHDVEQAAAAIAESRVVVAQLEVPQTVVSAGMRLARGVGSITLLNPAPAPEGELLPELLGSIDIINPNRTELGRLAHTEVCSIADAAAAARTLLSLGIRGVVVTLGADGALVVDASGEEHVPAYAVRPVDATGAGDAFTAGLAVALAEGANLRAAARYANAVAALATTRLGAQPSMPTRAEVDRLAAIGSPDPLALLPYHVSVPQFDGPLDLLLQVIERNKLDITTVSLALVADQFLDHIRASEKVDTDQLAEFVVIGAKLLLIKSRALLPQDKHVASGADDEVAIDLTRRLRVYEAFRRSAAWLRAREESGLHSYPRTHQFGGVSSPPLLLGLGETTLPMLQVAYQQALTRRRPEPRIGEVAREIWTVRSALHWLVGALETGRQSFHGLASAFRRPRLIASFLALLETTRLGLTRVDQSETFGDISVELAVTGEALVAQLAAAERDRAISPRSAEGPGLYVLREDDQDSAAATG